MGEEPTDGAMQMSKLAGTPCIKCAHIIRGGMKIDLARCLAHIDGPGTDEWTDKTDICMVGRPLAPLEPRFCTIVRQYDYDFGECPKFRRKAPKAPKAPGLWARITRRIRPAPVMGGWRTNRRPRGRGRGTSGKNAKTAD